MSNIEQNLQKILTSRYGKDVRQSIHDSIHDCYEDGKAGAVDLVAREQIANLVSNNNPTEGNSELLDIRVGADGKTYESAGTAVREQIGSLNEDLNLLFERDFGVYFLDGATKAERSVCRNIKRIIFLGDVDFSQYRLSIVVNSERFNKVITFSNSDGLIYGVLRGYDETTKMNYVYLTADKTKGILIEYDWDNHTSDMDINLLFENSHICLTGDNSVKVDIDELREHANITDSNLELVDKKVDAFRDETIGILDIKRLKETDIVSTDYENRYINTDGSLSSISNTIFHILKFPVEANKTYKIYGNDIRLNANLPLASFSTTDFDGSKVIKTDIIMNGESALTSQNYDVDYSPIADGYIYCAFVNDDRPVLSVATTSIIPNLVYKLSNSNTDTVKIQTFGDSITDEVWRADKTTWATLLADLIPQRKIDLLNSAVGGSGIGHGYANGGGRFPEKTDGNFVHDLMTDGTLRNDNDIVIMFVGTNNWAGGGALGQWGDDTVSTFYGSARLICDYITKNTKSLFIVCTPTGRYNATDETRETNADGEPVNNQSKTLRDYCDALVRTCHFYGVPVVDLNYDLGWNRNNVRNFCSDGLHPTADGAKCIARMMASEIRKHLGI